MAVPRSLVEWVQHEIDHVGLTADEVILDEDYIKSVIKRRRIIDLRRSVLFLNSDDDIGSITRGAEQRSGRLRFKMIDLKRGSDSGTATIYSYPYAYAVHEDGLEVHADGDLVDPADYSYDAINMEITFAPALSPEPTQVTLTGHLVNMLSRGVLYDCFDSIAGRFSMLQSVRGQEYEELAARIRKTANMRFGSRIVRRRR